MDSVYAGFENGAWLQVRRIDDLNDEQRGRLRATPDANIAINLVRPTPGGDLPMRRIFEDQQGNLVGQLDLWKYGYDPRKRSWYHETVKADRALDLRRLSSPKAETVDKFIGDAVMVFWNAPNPQPDHVERACRAALAGRAACEELNSQFETEGLKPFFTRFGIHVGEAVVGNLGSTERMNYTALGNTVNLAARLEGLNKQFGTTILVSEGVYSRVRHCFQFRAFESVIAKGMTKETRVFELVGAAT